MNTKLILIAGLTTGLALQLSSSALANSYSTTVSALPNVLIPDYNLNGVSSSVNVSSEMAHITGVTVTVDVAGDLNAWDGDYYCYLEYDSTMVVLLNRLGAPGNGGYGAPGNGFFDVTFSQAAPNISTAPNLLTSLAPLTGTYAPQVGNLNSFNGLAPTGTWTLFIADESAGDVGTLVSWSLNVVGVPDNGGTMLLLGMGVGCLGLFSYRQHRTAPISRN